MIIRTHRTKHCASCTRDVSVDMFTRDRGRKDGLNPYCVTCNRRKNRDWARENRDKKNRYGKQFHERNPQYTKTMHLRLKYGMTPQQADDMYLSQGSACAICKHQIEQRLRVIDHCHATGRVRGILCSQCNSGIGMLGDDLDRILAAAHYIKNGVVYSGVGAEGHGNHAHFAV